MCGSIKRQLSGLLGKMSNKKAKKEGKNDCKKKEEIVWKALIHGMAGNIGLRRYIEKNGGTKLSEKARNVNKKVGQRDTWIVLLLRVAFCKQMKVKVL